MAPAAQAVVDRRVVVPAAWLSATATSPIWLWDTFLGATVTMGDSLWDTWSGEVAWTMGLGLGGMGGHMVWLSCIEQVWEHSVGLGLGGRGDDWEELVSHPMLPR